MSPSSVCHTILTGIIDVRFASKVSTIRAAAPYFITICTKNRQCVFGTIKNGRMALSRRGEIVKACWADIPNHHRHVGVDEFVAMPNHLHGVLWFVGDIEQRATQASPLRESPSVGATPASPSSRPRAPLPIRSAPSSDRSNPPCREISIACDLVRRRISGNLITTSTSFGTTTRWRRYANTS